MSRKLTYKQKKGIGALMEHPTIESAAIAAGVNPRTVYRWMDDKDFRLALSQAEGAALDKITRKLILLGDHAVNALADVLQNPAQRGASNRRLAAQAVLDHLMKLRELRSIENRVAELEVKVYGQSK